MLESIGGKGEVMEYEDKYLPPKYRKEFDEIVQEYLSISEDDVDFDKMNAFIRSRASEELMSEILKYEKMIEEDEARAREEAEPGERFIIG